MRVTSGAEPPLACAHCLGPGYGSLLSHGGGLDNDMRLQLREVLGYQLQVPYAHPCANGICPSPEPGTSRHRHPSSRLLLGSAGLAMSLFPLSPPSLAPWAALSPL